MAIETTSTTYSGAPTYSGNTLVEVLDRILDKGIVIDVYARVSLIGIEILTVEARVVIASVETYLIYAEAIGMTANVARPLAYPAAVPMTRPMTVPSGAAEPIG